MKFHFDQVKSLRSAIDDASNSGNVLFKKDRYNDRKLLVGAIMHSCDIGAQMYPVEVASEWAERLIREFNEQAKNERQRGIPVAPFRDALHDLATVARLQLNFIDYIVAPLWSVMMAMFPEVEVLRHNMECNRQRYKIYLSDEEAEKGKTDMTSTDEEAGKDKTEKSSSDTEKCDVHNNSILDKAKRDAS